MEIQLPVVKKPRGIPFQPGNKLNPNGRPKKTKEDEDIKAMAKSIAPEVFQRLVFWANSNNGKIAVQACNSILDRAYGKPTQQIDHGNANDKPLRFTISLGRD